jgi:putative CocE/NonD family hydrolase
MSGSLNGQSSFNCRSDGDDPKDDKRSGPGALITWPQLFSMAMLPFHMQRASFASPSVVTAVLILACSSFLAGQTAPPGSGQTKIRKEYNVLIPMRDGIRLSSNIYRPDSEGKFPVVLVRTPYGKDSKAVSGQAEYFAQHGYAYVTQDVRGRYDSEGDFTVLANEAHDGYDTIEWFAKQSWSNGNVGTFGGSYLSWNQWLAAEERPPHLKAMVVQSTPPDIFDVAWSGAFSINNIFWCILLDGRTNQDLSVYDEHLSSHLPVSTMNEVAGRHLDKTFQAWIQHDSFDDFWRVQGYQNRLSRVNVPVLHLDGWYDMRDVSATLSNYNTILKGGLAPQRVVIGPWEHAGYDARKIGDIDFGPEAVIDRKALFLTWYDCYLQQKNCEEIKRIPPLKVFLLGENRWQDEQEWPPKRAQATQFYFHSQGHANTSTGDGGLTRTLPGNEPADHYIYDPNDPTTVILQSNSGKDALSADQRKAESRPDMLVFTSPPLDAPLEVSGHIQARLWAASSAPDTDWVVRLVDVHPDGHAQRLLDEIVRARYRESTTFARSYEKFSLLTPGKIYDYDIDIGDIANVFLKGHRIRVEIASSFFPLYSRNLNTGKDNLTTTELKPAHQTLYHDAEHPSQITLPLVPH